MYLSGLNNSSFIHSTSKLSKCKSLPVFIAKNNLNKSYSDSSVYISSLSFDQLNLHKDDKIKYNYNKNSKSKDKFIFVYILYIYMVSI